MAARRRTLTRNWPFSGRKWWVILWYIVWQSDKDLEKCSWQILFEKWYLIDIVWQSAIPHLKRFWKVFLVLWYDVTSSKNPGESSPDRYESPLSVVVSQRDNSGEHLVTVTANLYSFWNFNLFSQHFTSIPKMSTFSTYCRSSRPSKADIFLCHHT